MTSAVDPNLSFFSGWDGLKNVTTNIQHGS